MARILIIDDEPGIRSTLAGILDDEGHRAALVRVGRGGDRAATRATSSTSCCSTSGCPASTAWPCWSVCATANGPPVIMISGHGSVDSAVRATRLGAYDFLEKPLSLERVLLTVNHALSDRRLREQVRDLKPPVHARRDPHR